MTNKNTRFRLEKCLAIALYTALSCFMIIGTASSATQEIVAGEEYDRSSFYRWLWGENYRDVWETPVDVEVLDLQSEGGGLTPLFRVGGNQTYGLAFKGADGRSYTFRSITKNLRDFLPPEWTDSIFAIAVQDQVSASHPAVSSVIW